MGILCKAEISLFRVDRLRLFVFCRRLRDVFSICPLCFDLFVFALSVVVV